MLDSSHRTADGEGAPSPDRSETPDPESGDAEPPRYAYTYIAIEGAIGVGKTTLATFLADRLQARLILEEVEENPFLAQFYRDRRRTAFQAQLFFLLSRHRQQRELAQMDLFQRMVVSDYIFEKDRIFASINLNEHERTLYDHIVHLLDQHVVRPDLVVYLQASTDALMKRIHQRGRSYERSMEVEYIRTLNEAYNQFFFHYTMSSLLIVNASELNLVGDGKQLEHLLRQILRPFQGTKWYVPMGDP